jgi:nucleoid-associated protein YgaU
MARPPAPRPTLGAGAEDREAGSDRPSMPWHPYVAGLARRGRYREAEEWLAVLLRTAPDVDLYCLLGKVHAQQRHYEQAAAAFRRAFELEPGHTASAAALARLERMNAARWVWPMGAWRVGAAAIGLLVAIAVVPIALGTAWRVAGAPAGDAQPPVTVGTGGSLPAPDLDVRLLDEYATLLDSLRPLRAVSRLVVTPRRVGSRLTVRITGSVPTDHLARVVEHAVSGVGQIDIDATGVHVTHSYVVQPGDTLSSIARLLYGDNRSWSALWAANRRTVPHPGVIHPGVSLAAP